MKKVNINADKCKGCRLCMDVCPKNILQFSNRFNEAGYNYVECIDDESCIVCKSCAIVCPDLVFTLNRPAKQGAENG